MADKKCAIGIDLGGTKIALGTVDGEGRVIRMLRYETDAQGGPDSVIARIAKGVAQLKDGTGCSLSELGIGVAGQIDPVTGGVRFAPNLDWHDVPLRVDLERLTGLRVAVANDVRAAMWGEWLFGAGRGSRDLVCVFVGTGIGGGIISGGRVLEGCSNTAGEIGHMTIELNGPLCHCGNRGCFEAVAGGWAIAKKTQEMVRAHPVAGGTILKIADGNIENITARTLVDAYHEGDAAARQIMDEVCNALAAGVASLVNAFNPCHIVLGGGIIEGMPELVPRIAQGVRNRALDTAIKELVVIPSMLGNDAGIIGAAALAMKTFGGE